MIVFFVFCVSAAQGGAASLRPVDALDEAKLGVAAQFVAIKAGEFEMGSPEDEEGRSSYVNSEYDDETHHRVRLTRDYEMQATEVTQLQYFLVMGSNPSVFRKRENCDGEVFEGSSGGPGLCVKHPVENVSWEDAQKFIAELNRIQRKYVYRLPTEAEWEYAARGGTPFRLPYWFSFDIPPSSERDGETSSPRIKYILKNLGRYGWYDRNSSGRTHAVASKTANPWGLYDMNGNVWEWVQDFYGDYPKADIIEDPQGPSTGSFRVVRGGSWGNCARGLRSADRRGDFPSHHEDRLGLRLVRVLRE